MHSSRLAWWLSHPVGHAVSKRPVQRAFVGHVEIPQQTTLRGEAMNAGKKRLQPFKVGRPLLCDQFVLSFFPRPMPLLCNAGRTLSCVGRAGVTKPRLLGQSLILPRRTVHIIANRTTGGDFLVGNHSTDDQSVAKNHSS